MTEACAKTDGISRHSLNFRFLFSILILTSYFFIVFLVPIGLPLTIICLAFTVLSVQRLNLRSGSHLVLSTRFKYYQSLSFLPRGKSLPLPPRLRHI